VDKYGLKRVSFLLNYGTNVGGITPKP